MIKKLKLNQIYVDNLVKIGMCANIELSKPIKLLNYHFFQTLFKKFVIPSLPFLGLISRIDISFVTKKREIELSKKKFIKKFLLENKLLFPKEYKIVNSYKEKF